tara:strand:- start:559 stop:903 length:345 start_codon:yes stop_codon:yes gene_type:complete
MTKRHDKGKDGKYHIKGKTYKILRGSRTQVWNGTAYKTDGTPGLQKKDLYKNDRGRIVSLSKHKLGKTKDINKLRDAGYYTRKGKFGAMYKGKTVVKKKRSKKSSKNRGNTRKR